MHPLEKVINEAEGIVVIGDSAADRFPALSYNAYTKMGKRFYCLDLGGLTESRGPTRGGKVYTSVEELPADRGELAVVWVHPHRAAEAVEIAKSAGCTRVWFSFATGHPDAVKRAAELGLEVVEIGRCPIYYLQGDGKPGACAGHTAMVKLTGAYKRPPQLDPNAKRRETW